MKIETKKLASALGKIAGILAIRTAHPMSSYLRIESDGVSLKINAFKVEYWGEVVVECEGRIGALCASKDIFLELIGRAGEFIELSLDGTKLTFESGFKVVTSVLDVSDWPTFPVDKFTSVGVNTADLSGAMSRVLWAAAGSDEARSWMQCVQVKCDGKSMIAQCANGKTCGIVERPAIAAEFSFSIRKEYGSQLCEALLSDGSALSISEGYVRSSSPTLMVAIRRSDVPFIEDVKKIVTLECNDIGMIDRREFVRTLESILSIERYSGLNFSPTQIAFEPDGATVTCSTATSFEQRIAGQFEPLKASVNASSLLAALKSIDSDQVMLSNRQKMYRLVCGDYMCMCMGLQEK